MAFSTGTSTNVRLSWMFGDTPCYRFVFIIPSDAQLPPGTMVDFSIRTPNGIKVVNMTRLLEQPMGNLPYFEVFIAPSVSLGIPPGNYLLHLALKRPYGGDGNYRYTPIPSGNVTVGGIHCLHPDWLVDLDGMTDPPPATEVHIDARKFIARLPAHIHIPEPPSEPEIPTEVEFIVQTTPEAPTTLEFVTETTLVATIVKNTEAIVGDVVFKADGVEIHREDAPTNGGVVQYTYTEEYSAPVVFSVELGDIVESFTVTFEYVPVIPTEVELAVQTIPEVPTIFDSVTETTLVAKLVKNTFDITGDVVFKADGVEIHREAAPASGGVVQYTYMEEYSVPVVFSVEVEDITQSSTIVFVAPIGWMGVWYPESDATPFVEHYPGFDLMSALSLNSTVEITGEKGDRLFTVTPDEDDWNAIVPNPPQPFSNWVDIGVRWFILIKEQDWGVIQQWTAGGEFNETPNAPHNVLSVEIAGVTYNGIMGNTVADTFPLCFKFV